MAKILPQLGTIKHSKITSGERRLGQRLETLLEDDYTVWFDIPLGRKRRYPDYIVLHPSRGLLFLEVKDWKIDTLKRISPHDVEIYTPDGIKTVSNPLEQARQYAHVAINQLQRDEQLKEKRGRFKGNLCFPYGYGVVFPNITRKQWNSVLSEEEQDLVLPPHRLICRDEMRSTEDPEVFQGRLWAMFEYVFGERLSLPQIDRIRWNLFPEIRINTSQENLFPVNDPGEAAESENYSGNKEGESGSQRPADVIPEIVRVMDLQQEQLARSMGEGHRVIHGVAGSGKTLILGYRCLHLAQAVSKPILVLCFNITLAAKLRSFILEKQIDHKVEVHHFHEWCGRQLRIYNVDLLNDRGREHFENQVNSVIAGVQKGLIPRAQYSAVMVDEGHDFEREWLELIVQMVDPDTNSLLLLYDDAQSIYKKRSLKFPLSSADIQARGRTTILRMNYRNSREILSFAYEFAKDFLHARDADDDNIPLLAPEEAGFRGPNPDFRQFHNFEEEAWFIARCIRKWKHDDKNLNDVAIIYGYHWQAETIERALRKAGVPYVLLRNQADKRNYDVKANKVALMTRHSSKGLEFDTVVLAGIGNINDEDESFEDEVRLLYVGMTRARKNLLLTASRENSYVAMMRRLAGQLA